MPSRRIMSWSAALRDLKADRASLPPIREERLRSAAGLLGNPPLALSAWRGRSGLRYVTGVHDLDTDAIADRGPCVAIAVRRDDAGIASIVSATAFEGDADALAAFVDAARTAGATELQIHRLAASAARRAAIAADLTEPGPLA